MAGHNGRPSIGPGARPLPPTTPLRRSPSSVSTARVVERSRHEPSGDINRSRTARCSLSHPGSRSPRALPRAVTVFKLAAMRHGVITNRDDDTAERAATRARTAARLVPASVQQFDLAGRETPPPDPSPHRSDDHPTRPVLGDIEKRPLERPRRRDIDISPDRDTTVPSSIRWVDTPNSWGASSLPLPAGGLATAAEVGAPRQPAEADSLRPRALMCADIRRPPASRAVCRPVVGPRSLSTGG
jgi:hypothetical protein